jgi:AraC-like DNA-binding protein
MVLTAGCALYPAIPLRGHVERYVYVDTPVSPHIIKPLSPRPESGISFNLNCQDPLRLEYACAQVVTHPTAAVFGPLSHRIADIRCSGHYRAFNILFKGTGYHRLFGISPAELADRVSDARDVMGRAESIVHEQLCAARSAEAMAEVVDRYLLAKLTDGDLHPIHRVVEHLVASQGCANLCELSQRSGLSARQIERKFLEQIGITPKRYARLARFRNAARLKAENAALTWTDVSQATGFYDHNHLVKDFRELVDATPSDYLRSISAALETELWCAPADAQDRPTAPSPGDRQLRSPAKRGGCSAS